MEGEIPPENSGRNQQSSITFFLSNLPDGITSEELWEEYRRCGFLVDAYVARKKDKFGKMLAFVRYDRVRDSDKMVKALNNLRLYGRRIYAKVALFSKEDSRSRKKGRHGASSSHGEQPMRHDGSNRGVLKNQSYREMLSGIKDDQLYGEPLMLNLEENMADTPHSWIGMSVVCLVNLKLKRVKTGSQVKKL